MKKLLCLLIAFLVSSISYADQRAILADEAVKSLNPLEVYSTSAALVIGVSSYGNGWSHLPGVKDDIKVISELLSAKGFTVEKVSDVGILGFQSKLESFLRRYGKDNNARLVVYYAGHGHTLGSGDDKVGYLVLKGAKDPKKDVAGFKAGSIPMSYFAKQAASVKAKHVLFVFDSCFAGTVFSGMRSIPQFIIDMLKKPVRQFLASGNENQMVPDDSVFRRRFVDGIRGAADGDGDRVVTGSELGQYIQATVSSYSQGMQTPVFGKLKPDSGEILFFSQPAYDVRQSKDNEKQQKNPVKLSWEKERLLMVIKKNPHSPGASKALERLREIDVTLQNMPPVTTPERKDIKYTVSAKANWLKQGEQYPYMLMNPVFVPWKDGELKVAFKIKAKNRKAFQKMKIRKKMMDSVLQKFMKESNLLLIDSLSEIRDRMKVSADEAIDFACPGCIGEQPRISGISF
jgi:hypothetical protein